MVLRAFNLWFYGPTRVKIRYVRVFNTQMNTEQEKSYFQKPDSFIQFDILV